MPNFEGKSDLEQESQNKELKELLERLKNNITVAQKHIPGAFVSRYEARDEVTGKIYCSEIWNSSDGNIASEDKFPLVKEISEEEAWLDERGFIKDEHR